MLNRAFWITGVISVALLSACETVKQTENVGPNNTTALAARQRRQGHQRHGRIRRAVQRAHGDEGRGQEPDPARFQHRR